MHAFDRDLKSYIVPMTIYRPYPLDLVAELQDRLRERAHAQDKESSGVRERRDARVSKLVARLVNFRPPHEGDRVLGTRLESSLGTGEFGRVWRAIRLDNGEPCAVKVFHQHRLSEGRMMEEFRQGVAAMRLLTRSSPPRSIVRLEDAEDSELVFSMALVDGKDLRNISRRGWSLDKKLAVFCQLCEAVEFGHDHNVIHRDLKPANIVMDPNEEPVLTDFDLADLTTLRTMTARSPGSLAYAAPEQIESHVSALGRKRLLESDVYSLGRLLYFLVLERDPPVLDRSEVLEELKSYEGLRRIVRQCTLDDPGKRYRSVRDLVLQVRRHDRDPTTVGCSLGISPEKHSLHDIPAQPTTKPKRSLSRHPMAVNVTAAAITAVALVGAAFVPLYHSKRIEAATPASSNPSSLESARTIAPKNPAPLRATPAFAAPSGPPDADGSPNEKPEPCCAGLACSSRPLHCASGLTRVPCEEALANPDRSWQVQVSGVDPPDVRDVHFCVSIGDQLQCTGSDDEFRPGRLRKLVSSAELKSHPLTVSVHAGSRSSRRAELLARRSYRRVTVNTSTVCNGYVFRFAQGPVRKLSVFLREPHAG